MLRRKRQLLLVEVQPVLHVPVLHGLLYKRLTSEVFVASSKPLQDCKVFLNSGKAFAQCIWIARPPPNDGEHEEPKGDGLKRIA